MFLCPTQKPARTIRCIVPAIAQPNPNSAFSGLDSGPQICRPHDRRILSPVLSELCLFSTYNPNTLCCCCCCCTNCTSTGRLCLVVNSYTGICLLVSCSRRFEATAEQIDLTVKAANSPLILPARENTPTTTVMTK